VVEKTAARTTRAGNKMKLRCTTIFVDMRGCVFFDAGGRPKVATPCNRCLNRPRIGWRRARAEFAADGVPPRERHLPGFWHLDIGHKIDRRCRRPFPRNGFVLGSGQPRFEDVSFVFRPLPRFAARASWDFSGDRHPRPCFSNRVRQTLRCARTPRRSDRRSGRRRLSGLCPECRTRWPRDGRRAASAPPARR